MKKTLSLFLLLFSYVAFSQQSGNISINWTPAHVYSFGDYNVNIPQFDSPNFYFDSYRKEVLFRFSSDQPTDINEKSLQITNITYEAISAAELGELSIKAIPEKINATLKSIHSRDEFAANIILSPIIKDASGFKKVKSFSYSFSAGSSSKLLAPGDEFGSRRNSVLTAGDWYRFYVTKSGAYRIDKAFLKAIGVNVDGLDPRKIKIYGNGGRMIPLKNSDYYPADLTENAIIVAGENDGVFNDTDFAVFYAEGIDVFNADSDTNNNLYADKSYYYVNVQGADGKRIAAMTQPSFPATVNITAFDNYQYHEIDAVNVVRLGRRWFGEVFDIDAEQEFTFNIPNIVTTEPVKITAYAGASALVPTSFKFNVNGQDLGTINLSITDDHTLLRAGSVQMSAPASENMTVKVSYLNNNVPGSKGYLDYIRVKSKRSLRGTGQQFPFQYDAAASTSGFGEYQFSNAGGINQIWDVTDIFNVSNIENNGQNAFSFKASLGEVRKYVAVDFNNLYSPDRDSNTRVSNQNLKGNIFNNSQGQPGDIDYIIVAPPQFMAQAERLANFHRNYSLLTVKVISLDDIYQEFSSGKQDIGAIRNFMKYVYKNPLDPNRKVKYLNLFGDASFDFKNRVSAFSNFVPIYHALDGFSDGEDSFCSDDFFGLYDDNEGNITPTTSSGLDIAVGRMIAGSASQGDALVDKVIDYHDIKSYGNWRNNFVAVADDADKDGDASLQSNMNNLADKIVLEKPFINATKILMDAYVQESSSGGGRYPKAKADLFNAFEKGALVFDYLGHGGEDGLSQERIFQTADGQNLNNKYKYPLFITITCEFTRFDNPFRPTAGEYTYWNSHGGAISLITTVRSIGQSTGESFNILLSKYLFSYGSNEYVSIAEALRRAKRDPGAPTVNVVFYIGDPALMLAIPKPNIRLTKINDIPIADVTEPLKALAYAKLTGEVVDENNNPLPSYNGDLAIQIFDKMLTKQTRNNDGQSPPINFTTLGETIFRGNASVANGKFEFGFVVPRDIAIGVGDGRASFYAKRGQILLDKSGYNNSVKIGGINESAELDTTGPTVKLYMNDQTFVSGGITNESPIFLAFLEDEHGINTASGIGHDIVAILDGDENNPYKLNDYYETELDDYKKGKLKFPFRDLAVGLHTITFKAFDVYNNLVTAEIQFLVVNDDSVTITNVLNYPNPFVNYTQFWFTHNKPFEPLEVQVQVLTITGKVVWTKNQTITTDGFLSREITWDGKDDFGDKIGKGVYVYKLTVKSLLTNTKTHKYEKLVIL
ncbi:peptidase C25 [Flavobacterium noncentrifugens]|uniref:Por secretion system C-terminal sorting domain-containing protein n=1 Tax=Flavobacterium noncentrifugens TaxID=1128970 RepID=A0A1G8UPS5_9FLAO|nr:type IX secretion system sortase PorU [Flavobacterium noncentrifugens]GEP52615.1 peptidase C25 [Flavobacterium noncentrifugens]SDJ55886.1 Por secretion system C-terminal sorting domain-containing protein [Flavobacterium noncentrifugens]